VCVCGGGWRKSRWGAGHARSFTVKLETTGRERRLGEEGRVVVMGGGGQGRA
jgi:hypothetical protein